MSGSQMRQGFGGMGGGQGGMGYGGGGFGGFRPQNRSMSAFGGYGGGNYGGGGYGGQGAPRTGGNDYYQTSGMHPVQQAPQYAPQAPQQFSSIPPWANQNQPGSPYNTSGMAKPMALPNGQPQTGGNDVFPDSGMHPVQQTQYQPYRPPEIGNMASPMQTPQSSQPQTGGADYQNAGTPQAYQPASQPQSWAQESAGLLRPSMDPSMFQQASSPIPPGPGNPNTPPPSQMQNGQVGWAWNAGTSGINPQGWNAQFTPGYQQYISSMTAGLNPQQRGQVDYNNLIGSLGQVTGQQYNPNIYGQR